MAQGPKSRLSAYLFVIGTALFLAACTTTETFEASGKVQAPPGGGTILVMPVDVTLYEVSAGGLSNVSAFGTD